MNQFVNYFSNNRRPTRSFSAWRILCHIIPCHLRNIANLTVKAVPVQVNQYLLKLVGKSLPHLVDNPLGYLIVVGLGDSSGYAAKRVAVATKRDSKSYTTLKIRAFIKCRQSLRHSSLA